MLWKIAVVEFLKPIANYLHAGQNLRKLQVKKLIFSKVVGFSHTHKIFRKQIQESVEPLTWSFY